MPAARDRPEGAVPLQPALRAVPALRGEGREAEETELYVAELIGKSVEVRATTTTVELLHGGRRVAGHARSFGPKGTAVTDPSHRPKSHGDWPPSRVIGRAENLGPSVGDVARKILAAQPHPREAQPLVPRADRGSHDHGLVEAACRRALEIGAPIRQSVLAILRRGLDRFAVEPSPGGLEATDLSGFISVGRPASYSLRQVHNDGIKVRMFRCMTPARTALPMFALLACGPDSNTTAGATTAMSEPTAATAGPDTDGPTTDGSNSGTPTMATTSEHSTESTVTEDPSETADSNASSSDPGETATGEFDCSIVVFAEPSIENAVREAFSLPPGPIAGDSVTGEVSMSLQRASTGSIVDLGGIECVTGLVSLTLYGYKELTDISPLTALSKLDFLSLQGGGVADLSPLAGLLALERLEIAETPVHDLSPLQALPGLTHLNARLSAVDDLTALAGVSTLQRLDLGHTKTSDLTPLAGLADLSELLLTGTGITDLEPLSGLSQLSSLAIENTAIESLAPLMGLPIVVLQAGGCAITDLSPIASFPTPDFISLDNNKIVEVDALASVEWLVPPRKCATLSLLDNPLSKQATMQVLPDLCATHHIEVTCDDLQCLGNDACAMP